ARTKGSPSALACRRFSGTPRPASRAGEPACPGPSLQARGNTPPPMPRFARPSSSLPDPSASSLADLPYLPAAPLGSRGRRLGRVPALIRDSQLGRKRSHAPRLLITHVQQRLQLRCVTACNHRFNL